MKNKKFILAIGSLVLLLAGSCSSTTVTAKNDRPSGMYFESNDNIDGFEVIKAVDVETGCKYLIVNSTINSRQIMQQMRGSDDKPLCTGK